MNLDLRKCQALVSAARKGDRAALATLRNVKALAQAKDPRALLAWGTLAALFWGAAPASGQMRSSGFEELYKKLVEGCPEAWTLFRNMKAAADQQDPHGLRAVAIVKAIHNRNKKSYWYPGAPKVGHHPMPAVNRPGIVFGGVEGAPRYASAPVRQHASMKRRDHRATGPLAHWPTGGSPMRPIIGVDIPLGNLGSIPGLPSLPGTPQGNPLGQLGGLIPGLGGQAVPGSIPGLPQGFPGLPGFGPSPAPPPGQFLPLSQNVVTGLLALIASARGPQVFSASNQMSPNQSYKTAAQQLGSALQRGDIAAAQAAQAQAMKAAASALHGGAPQRAPAPNTTPKPGGPFQSAVSKFLHR